MIAKYAKYPKEAADLLFDLCYGFGQEETAKLGWNIPTTKKAGEGVNFAGDKTYGAMNRMILSEAPITKPFVFPPKLNAANFNQQYMSMAESLQADGADVERILKEFAAKYNAQLQ